MKRTTSLAASKATRDEAEAFFPFHPAAPPKKTRGLDLLTLYLDARDWKLHKMKGAVHQQAKELEKNQALLAKGLKGDPSAVGKQDLPGQGMQPQASASDEVLETGETAYQGMAALFRLTLNTTGPVQTQAVKRFFELCLDATVFLQGLYKSRPEMLREATRYYAKIPVLAGLDPQWKQQAAHHLKHLNVGAALAEGSFKEVAYEDDVHICRRWAREAVKCLSRNRYTPSYLVEIYDYLMANPQVEASLSEMPDWVREACALKPFSRSTAKAWGRVARRMIRHQCPDFDKEAEFSPLVAGIKRRFHDAPAEARNRRGTIQNALLDKIVEAIETIAGEPPQITGIEAPEFQ